MTDLLTSFLAGIRGLNSGEARLNQAPASPDAGWKEKAEVFRHSYTEVLSALKHQDDKLGRSLTAVAFLTAGGIALFTQLGQRAELKFDDAPMLVSTFFFIVFLVSIVLALSLILAAIGPSTMYRRRDVWKQDPRSLLFYASIRSDPDWDSYIDKTPAELLQQLTRNFHYEAHILAKRVHYKIARSREAGAFIHLAVLSLLLLGVFSLSSLEELTRWRIGAAILLIVSLLPLWDIMQMSHFEFPEGTPRPSTYWCLGGNVLLEIVLLTLGPDNGGEWMAISHALAVVFSARLGFVRSDFTFLLYCTLFAGVFLVVIVLR